MSAPSRQPDGAPAAAHSRSRSVPLLVAACVLVVTVVGAVLLFGITRPPELASVTDAPEPMPSAPVAWTAWDGGERCVFVARPDGTVREVRCDPDGGELLGWTDDDRLLLARYDTSRRMLEVDPATGAVIGTSELADPEGRPPPRPPSNRAVTSFRAGDALVIEREGVELWRVAAPDGYDVRSSSVSPDGRFVAMVDSADRLLLVPADGSAPPRVWSQDAQRFTAPVWRGGWDRR